MFGLNCHLFCSMFGHLFYQYALNIIILQHLLSLGAIKFMSHEVTSH